MSKILLIAFLIVSLFIIGFISYPIIESMLLKDINIPLSFSETREKDSPSDWIKEDQIELSDDYVKVNLKDAYVVKFANTNSMDPMLDENSNGIEIKPKYASQISVGDVVAYDKSEIEKNIIHRIVDIGSDEKGIYYIVKGDNNDVIDSIRVRFSDIKYVLVGVLY